MASSCASDIRSVTVAVASSSLGISDATTRTNSTGCVHAAVISAGLPKACRASQRSRKNSSLSLLREPCGRPLGLPDWPGFQGINPRCLCFRTVESLSATSAFDIIKSNPLRGSFECIAERLRMTGRDRPHPTTSSCVEVTLVPRPTTLEGLFLHRTARPRTYRRKVACTACASVGVWQLHSRRSVEATDTHTTSVCVGS